jgi:hypothetical protein
VLSITHQLTSTLVKAQHRLSWFVGFGVQVQHILHPPDECGFYLWDAPLLVLPRLELVFFNVRRTVSSLIRSIAGFAPAASLALSACPSA